MATKAVRVAVGSANPAKISAVTRAFRYYYPDCHVEGVAVESGVHHTPFNSDIVKGANARAKDARTKTSADFGAGLEGGILELDGKPFLTSYASITNGTRTHGAYSAMFELPPKVVNEVKKGKELNDVLVAMGAKHNNKQEDGAFGLYTDNAVTRSDAFYQAVIGALVPFRKSGQY